MATNYPILRLKRGKEESLDRFHPWVFSGALTAMPSDIDEGDLVRIVASDGRTIGVGHFQIGSIAVRMLAFDDIEIGAGFYRDCLAQAWLLRQRLGLTPAPTTRLSASSTARATSSPDWWLTSTATPPWSRPIRPACTSPARS